jgi:phosphohistidine phosphatase SixA
MMQINRHIKKYCLGLLIMMAAPLILAQTRIPETTLPGSPSVGNTCTPAQVGRVSGVVVCKAIRTSYFWVATHTLPDAQMREATASGRIAADVLERLKTGGYTIFMRHGRTDWNQAAIENPNQRAMYTDAKLAADCNAQRNLADTAREEVVMVGESLRRLNIQFDQVVVSPLCRIRETAGLLNVGSMRVDYGLFDTFMFAGHADTDVVRRSLQRMMAKTPAAGKNTLMVGHALNITQAMGGSMPAEGEMQIFQPDGKGGAKFIASIQVSQWAATR